VTYPAATGDIQTPTAATPAHPEERSAVIDLEAIRHNVRRLAAVASPARVMAVVKADAYGHGAVPVARAALSAGAGWLGVAHISEALALRAAGIEAPLLAWLHTPESNFGAAVAAGIDIGCSGWELDRIVAAAREQERPARIHLKGDTGLGRNGATPEAWDALVGEAVEYQDQGLLRVVGIFSHLAVADEPERPETDEQLAVFRELLAIAKDAGVDPEVRHLANTPATLSRPDTHFDLVRVGLGIYGLSPFEGQGSAEMGLRPAMTVRTLVSHCKDVPAGQGVSYGLNYRTDGTSTLGLIPLGYADGVPRVATGGHVARSEVDHHLVHRDPADDRVVHALHPDRATWPPAGRASSEPRPCCSATAKAAARRRRTGPGPPGPTTTRS
jgi:alanine racemase